MNSFDIHLGAVFLSLLVVIEYCEQTYAAARPCLGNCGEIPDLYNSGYSSITPPVFSTPSATQGISSHDYSGGYSSISPPVFSKPAAIQGMYSNDYSGGYSSISPPIFSTPAASQGTLDGYSGVYSTQFGNQGINPSGHFDGYSSFNPSVFSTPPTAQGINSVDYSGSYSPINSPVPSTPVTSQGMPSNGYFDGFSSSSPSDLFRPGLATQAGYPYQSQGNTPGYSGSYSSLSPPVFSKPLSSQGINSAQYSGPFVFSPTPLANQGKAASAGYSGGYAPINPPVLSTPLGPQGKISIKYSPFSSPAAGSSRGNNRPFGLMEDLSSEIIRTPGRMMKTFMDHFFNGNKSNRKF